MGLSQEEKETLERLSRKAKEPDAPPIGKSVQARIDFGDEKQIERAIQHGFLTRAEAEEIKREGDNGDNGDNGDEGPKRRGSFFGE